VSEKFDREGLRFSSLAGRTTKVSDRMLAGSWDQDSSALDFVRALPDVLAVKQMKTLARAMVRARGTGASRIFMYGGHVIKCGLGPLLVKWVRNGTVTCLATNGAGTIHDVEMAIFGSTSEDVESGIADGSFGMWQETSEMYGAAVDAASEQGLGLGQALAGELARRDGRRDVSPLMAALDAGIPLTVHPALGGDIVHPGKMVNWERMAAAAERDYDLLGEAVSGLSGGVVINAGSAVLLPEVFLKLLTAAVNLGADIGDITAANFDMIQHYRPGMNVVERPVRALGGTSVSVTGHHELMLPLLDLFIRLEEGGGDE
jgi:hypothetical protein